MAAGEVHVPLDYQFKLCLVGNSGGVGKTSLLLRFTDDTYTDGTYTDSFIGSPKVRTVSYDSNSIELQLWDTEGSERFRTWSGWGHYYRNTDGIYLVYDVTDHSTFSDLPYWIDDVERHIYTYTPCMVLVGNKCDLTSEHVVDLTLAKVFADDHNIPFLETSAKTSENVTEAFMIMAAEIMKKLPKKELSVEELSVSNPGIAKENVHKRTFFSGVWKSLLGQDRRRSKEEMVITKPAAPSEESNNNVKDTNCKTLIPAETQQRDLELHQLQLQLSNKEGENEELRFQLNILENKRQALENNIQTMDGVICKAEVTIAEQKECIQDKQREIKELQDAHKDRIQSLERDLLTKEDTIRGNEVTIAEQQEEIQRYRNNPYWVIEREEVVMMEDVLGKGGWGEVKVGIFRGTRVAVKCLHQIILSEYYLELFSREMDIASRVRHPNLLQFIGATRVGNPMIVTDLMPTSLRNELEKCPMTRPQVVGIGIDVASALNYLHLWKPQPILHRDVSSGNVLLEPSSGGRWKAKLSDYGSANLLDKIRNTTAPGSPAYSAPESQTPSLHSPAMDVYSFGILLMEMATGRFPSTILFEREAQIQNVKWLDLKMLIQCLTVRDFKSRPSTQNAIQDLSKL